MLLAIFLTPDSNNHIQVFIDFSNASGSFRSIYLFKQEIKEEKMFLTYLGPRPDSQNAIDLESQFQPLLDFCASTKGLYFEAKGSFLSSTASYSDLSGTLTSSETPSQRVYGFLF